MWKKLRNIQKKEKIELKEREIKEETNKRN